MSRVGGVTYYCRYVVLPLSYVSREGLDELRRTGALNPSTDIEATVRQWQNESFANLVNTFRHEMVHVHTNSALGVPRYSNRSAYPTWFHEGTATYLSADPHAGLSQGYQEYQEAFFYLAQRYGIPTLQQFYAEVLGGSDVATALSEIYAIADADRLFTESSRWHRVKDLIKTALWIHRSGHCDGRVPGRTDRPYIGALQVLAAVALGLAAATGLAEHLYGLRGPSVVVVGEDRDRRWSPSDSGAWGSGASDGSALGPSNQSEPDELILRSIQDMKSLLVANFGSQVRLTPRRRSPVRLRVWAGESSGVRTRTAWAAVPWRAGPLGWSSN